MTRTLLVVVALGLAVAISGGDAAWAASPLVAQWHMDAADGAESSGNAIATTVGPGTTVVPGRFGNALQSGGNATLLVPDNSPQIPLLQPQRVTVLLWFKQSGSPGTLRYLVSGGGEGPGNCLGSPYAIYSGVNASDGLQFYVRGVSGDHLTTGAGNGVYDGNWHMAAGTFDGTTSRLYIDGQQVGASTPGAPDAINYAIATDKSFRVSQYSATACGSFTFPGAIDETRVYDRALSATEIARMAAAPGPNPPDLVPDETGAGPPGATPLDRPVIRGLSAAAPLKSGSKMALVTASVVGADKLNWDISGDGKTDVSCDGDQQYLGVRLQAGAGRARAGATRLIKMVAVGKTGLASTPASVQVAPSQPAASQSSSGRRLTPPEVGMCSAVSRDIAGQVKALALYVNCTDQTVAFGIVEAKGCMNHVLDRDSLPKSEARVVDEYLGSNPDPKAPIDIFVSYKTVRINGMVFTARGGPIVLFPNLQRVVSRSGVMKFGSVTVRSGSLDLDLHAQKGVTYVAASARAQGPSARAAGFFDDINPKATYVPNPVGNVAMGLQGAATLASFDARKELPAIGGFPIDGQVTLQMVGQGGAHFSVLKVHVGMPDVFTAFGGRPPDASTDIRADNDHAPEIDNVDIRVPYLELGGVQFTDVAFHYTAHGDPQFNCGRPFWHAVGNVFIGSRKDAGGQAGFLLAPNPPQNGVAFCGGELAGAGGQVKFGGPIPPPQVFPGVFLQEIGLDIQVHPPLIHGTVTLNVARLTTVKGDLLIVLASPSEPYTLTGADAASFGGQHTRLVAPTLAVGGEVGIRVPGRDEPLGLGSGYALYEYPDYVALGGSVAVVVPGVRITGTLTGQFSARTNQFNIEGSVKGCIGVDLVCGTLAGWVSDRGVAACAGDIVHDDWVPGGGYGWGNILPEIWFPTGCKPSHYWDHGIQAPTARAAAAAGSVTFKVAKGEDSKGVQLITNGGAPNVTLTAPGGEKISTGPGSANVVHGAHLGLLRYQAGNMTIAGVVRGKPGTYTITPAAGSPAIVKVRETRADDHVSAKVTSKGDKRVLRYDAGLTGGKRVQFFERGKTVFRPLKTTAGGKGTLTFTPAPGPAGKRQIVARTSIDGAPAPDYVVASFTAPDRVSPGATRHVRARRAGSSLVVSWAPARNATRYGITVRQADGTYKLVRVGAKKHSVRVLVRADFPGTVSVHAQGLQGTWGKGATARFKQTAKRPVAFRDYRQLGKKKKAKAKRRR